jgi:hypothetical protein
MSEKVYMDPVLGKAGVTSTPCSGRYWHMQHEHGILEDYWPPSSHAELMEPSSE